MTPSTKALYDYLRRDGTVVEEPDFPTDDDVPEPTYLTLKMKKKRQQMLLKRMLADSGYQDLARMTNIGRERNDDDGDDRL